MEFTEWIVTSGDYQEPANRLICGKIRDLNEVLSGVLNETLNEAPNKALNEDLNESVPRNGPNDSAQAQSFDCDDPREF